MPLQKMEDKFGNGGIIHKKKNIPGFKIQGEKFAELGRRPESDILYSKKKTPMCVWVNVAGDITQTSAGDDTPKEDIEKFMQFNRFVTGREVVTVKWDEDNVIWGMIDDIIEDKEIERNPDEIVEDTLEKKIRVVFDKNQPWKKEWSFAFFTLPEISGNILYFMRERYHKYDEENETWYMSVALVEVNDRYNFLKDERRKQYFQNHAPSEEYQIPIVTKDERGRAILTAKVIPKKIPASCQIDFFGFFALSGIALYTENNYLVPTNALKLKNNILYRIQNLESELTYVCNAGITWLGQWKDWKIKIKDYYDLQVRPQFEGVLFYESFYNLQDYKYSNFARIKLKARYHYSSHIKDKIRDDNIYVKTLSPNITYEKTTDVTKINIFSVVHNTPLPNITNNTGYYPLTIQGKIGGGGYIAPVYGTFNLSEFLEFQIVTDTSELKAAPNFSDFSIENKQPLDFFTSDLPTISSPNIYAESNQYKNFTTFLALNSIANMDTIKLPVEIKEYVAVDISTWPIIGNFLFGVPAGYNYNIDNYTNYYDRKFNFIIPKTVFSLLSLGVFGEDENGNKVDNDNRMLLNAFTEQEGNAFLSKDYAAYGIHFEFKKIIKENNRQFHYEDYTGEVIKGIILQGLGAVEARITFFDSAGNQIWHTYFRTQASHTDSILDWTTNIVFKK